MAKYPYIVNKNGVWYPSGAEVPDGKNIRENKEDEAKQDDFSQYMNAPEIAEESTEVKYTKTEINRMSTAELKEVAKLNGVNDADDMTGGELKKVLIDKFGL